MVYFTSSFLRRIFGKENPRRLTLGEIELHKDYALVITTNSGLWAYMIGDMIRFISKDPYKILVSGRTKHFTSAFGEHVIAYEVEEAMKEAYFRTSGTNFRVSFSSTGKSGKWSPIS